MENRRNYYRILHVQPGAPVEIIRASYRTLMQRLRAHPDLGGDHWNAAIINEAYAVLTDADRRAEYDRDFQARVLDARSEGDAEPAAMERTRSSIRIGCCLFCQVPYPPIPRLRADATCASCGSPLQPLTARRIAGAGKRAAPRLPRCHPLQLYTTWPQTRAIPAETRDMSPNGISFATMELLRPRTIVKLESPLCRAVIAIRNTRVEDDGASGLWLMGAEFLSVIFAQSRGAFVSARA
jgi:hypothetical protein